MNIEIRNNCYDLSDFLFNVPEPVEKSAFVMETSRALSDWISGRKEFYFSTSGTTGSPKVLNLKRKWMEYSALQTINILGLWDERVYCCLSLQRIGGWMMVVRALAGGFDLKIVPPEADPLVNLEPHHTFSFISLVPYQFAAIMKNRESMAKLNRFRTILLGGSFLSNDLLSKVHDLSPHVYHTYGMTETCSHIALKKLNHDPWPHFIFNPGVEYRFDSNNILSVRGVQSGNEWIDTGDIVEMYPDRSFEPLGRIDFRINSGGIKTAPEILEKTIQDILRDHFSEMPEIFISSVLHPDLGEAIVLVTTETTFNFDLKEVEKILRLNLDKYNVPKYFIRFSAIPYNEGGKPDRRILKKMVKDYLDMECF